MLGGRKHIGLMPPAPVQAAMVAALGNDAHVATQRAVYGARREQLMEALVTAGFRIDDSAAGLYLWATRGESSLDTISWLADRGILAAPGSFYGDDPAIHVRLALTASDDDIARAAGRLMASN
jgi:aspartate/methionine/tyrosine aminotransferase